MMKKMEGKIITLFVLTLVLLPVVTVCGTQDSGKEMTFAEMENNSNALTVNSIDEQKNENLNVVTEAPSTPSISGPVTADLKTNYIYFISSKDPQNDEIYYKITCSDMPAFYMTEFHASGEVVTFGHTWSTFYQKSGPYYVYAQAIDTDGHKSDWAKFQVNIPEVESKSQTCHVCEILEKLYERFPILESIIGF